MALSLDTTIGAGGIIIAEATADTVTTASFSTAANIRLVALASSNSDATPRDHITISGGGLSWDHRLDVGVDTTDPANSVIAVAYSAGALSGITVQANAGTISSGDGVSLTVIGFLGAEVTHGGAENSAVANTGVPSCAVTSTRDGSYIVACSADWSAAGDYVVSGSSPAQTLLNTHHIAGQYSGGQSRSTNTVSIGTQTMGYTLTRQYSMAVIEIREDVSAAAAVITSAIQSAAPWAPVSNPTEVILGQVNPWA